MAPVDAPAKPSQAGQTPFSGREGARMSGARSRPALEVLCLLPDPEAVSFCSPHSHLCTLVLVGSRKEDVSRVCSGKTLQGRVDTFPLAGKVPECLKPVQTSLGRIQEPRCLQQMLQQWPPGPGGHLSSGREGARMSGARNGVCHKSSVAPTCPRSC